MAPRPKRRPMKPVSEAIRKWAQALAGRQKTTMKSAFGSLKPCDSDGAFVPRLVVGSILVLD
jgi:hypothetical protein